MPAREGHNLSPQLQIPEGLTGLVVAEPENHATPTRLAAASIHERKRQGMAFLLSPRVQRQQCQCRRQSTCSAYGTSATRSVCVHPNQARTHPGSPPRRDQSHLRNLLLAARSCCQAWVPCDCRAKERGDANGTEGEWVKQGYLGQWNKNADRPNVFQSNRVNGWGTKTKIDGT